MKEVEFLSLFSMEFSLLSILSDDIVEVLDLLG